MLKFVRIESKSVFILNFMVIILINLLIKCTIPHIDKTRVRKLNTKKPQNTNPLLRKTIIISFYLLFTLIVGCVALAFGMHSAINKDALFHAAMTFKKIVSPQEALAVQNINEFGQVTNEFAQLIKDPTKAPTQAPAITDKTMVAFVFGQSNSANGEGERFEANDHNVFNYFDNHYYIASDPLLGATGTAGSMWTITANKLIEKKMADKVILIAAGVGGTSVKQWRNGGDLNQMLENRLKETQKNHINITHFLWHQGESDNGTYESEYENGLTEVISLTQRYYPHAKFFVSQASGHCPDASSDSILNSQRDITKLENVFMGPNTDLIDAIDRWDGCHLSGRGVEKASNDWVERIKNPQKSS